MRVLTNDCTNDRGDRHEALGPNQDVQLQKVADWLVDRDRPIDSLMGEAILAAVDRVLDGSRTGRFDLSASDVDSDERRAVGVQLQYAVLDVLGLEKSRPLDTHIKGIPVDIKCTVAQNWSIPQEAQCEICLLVQIDADNYRHSAWLMRMHRRWLHRGKGNKDKKRGVVKQDLYDHAVELYLHAELLENPLRLLDDEGLNAVFAPGVGMRRRAVELFTRLPEVVVPRSVLTTIGYGLDDPLRRVRESRDELAAVGLELLCGAWIPQRTRASRLGFELGASGWVAVPTHAQGRRSGRIGMSQPCDYILSHRRQEPPDGHD